MFIHIRGNMSPVRSTTPTRRPVGDRPSAPGNKHDAILEAATQVFARRGFFNAQVADIARVAGVAAGTVYLYFSGKDDLLISIFERTMTDAIADARSALGTVSDPIDRLRWLARLHLERLGRDRDLAVVFQVELRQSTKFMERFSSAQLRRVSRPHPGSHRRGSGPRPISSRRERDGRRQDPVWGARRNDDELDPEPQTGTARESRGRRG